MKLTEKYLHKQGGHTQPEEIYKPKEHDGLKKDGTEDKRTNPSHGFGGEVICLLASEACVHLGAMNTHVSFGSWAMCPQTLIRSHVP